MIHHHAQRPITRIYGARRLKPTRITSNRFIVFAILCISLSTSYGFPPMTTFTTSPHLLPHHLHTALLHRKTQSGYNYRKYQKSSMRASIARSETNASGRRNKRSNSKLKSPSNSYTQFYKEGVLVGIESTSPNSRRISGEIIMDIPTHDIWNILTDYDNLSSHVPNLMESKVINNGNRIVGGKPRVYQRGAQRIFGFEFGADVTMDMSEYVYHDERKMYLIDFQCVDSQFFSQFDGSWILEEYANGKTMVTYIVDVRPKGPVPVAALEWRIKEDVPSNIVAVSRSARARSVERRKKEQADAARKRNDSAPRDENQQINKRAQNSGSTLQNRVRQSRTQSQSMSRLQQITDQATQNLKQTAKSFLPTPMISTAKQAINAINSSNPRTQRRVVPFLSLNDVGPKKDRLSEHDVDWYEDETMATYLKDF